jgi:hypothetical protein
MQLQGKVLFIRRDASIADFHGGNPFCAAKTVCFQWLARGHFYRAKGFPFAAKLIIPFYSFEYIKILAVLFVFYSDVALRRRLNGPESIPRETERFCMVRRTLYIRLLLALYLFALILSPRPAAANDPLPGDACSAGENAINTFQWNPTGDNGTVPASGVTNAIFCIGNVRKSIMTLQAATGYVGIGNTAPGSMLDVGKAGTTLGTLRLEGNTSGYVQIQPAAAAGSWTATLPATAGTSGYVLSTDGTGITSWISNAGTASTALSSITAAAAGHTIANANFAQVWNWDTLTTGNALTLESTSMTSGHLLNLVNNNAAASSSVLNVVTTTTTDYIAAIYGYATAATGAVDGVVGRTDSTTNYAEGVLGYATGTTGTIYGVEGKTPSTTAGATGVRGLAYGATGTTYGVYGETDSTTDNAYAIYGHATGATGKVFGVGGKTDSASTGAAATIGWASSATGAINGVYGEADSTTANAAGVYGGEYGATGATHGVYGRWPARPLALPP